MNEQGQGAELPPLGLPPPPSLGQAPPKPQGKRQLVDSQMLEKATKDVNTIGANLRILEERYSLMRNKSQVTEESMIELEKGLAKDIKSLNDEITDLKHELKDIMDKMRLIDSEMKSLTRKEEFKVLEKYLDMWQPMDFVTRAEIGRLIEQARRMQPQQPAPVPPARQPPLAQPAKASRKSAKGRGRKKE